MVCGVCVRRRGLATAVGAVEAAGVVAAGNTALAAPRVVVVRRSDELRVVHGLGGGGDSSAFVAQHMRELLDHLFASWRDTHLHDAPIFAGCVWLTLDQATLLRAVHQPDDGIVPH